MQNDGWVAIILGGPYVSGPLSGQSAFGPDSNTVTYYQYAVRTEQEIAAFVNFDYRVTDRLSIGLGIRRSETEFTNTEIQDGPWSGGFQRLDGKQEDSPTIGRFNVSYDMSDDSMVYFTWSEGFRLGGANQDYSGNPLCAPDLAAIGGQNPLTFTSDKLESYEVGTKSTLWEGRATLGASAYRIDWSDIQRQVLMPTCVNLYTDNFGEAEVIGVDIEFEMQLSDAFRLSAAWGRNDGEYTKNAIRGGQLYAKKGQEFSQPKVVANAALYYNGVFDNRGVYATLSVSYNGSYDRLGPVDLSSYTPQQEAIRDAESVTVASLRAGMELGSWNVGAFVENLFDSDAAVGQSLTAASRTDVTSRSLRPRVVGLSLKYAY